MRISSHLFPYNPLSLCTNDNIPFVIHSWSHSSGLNADAKFVLEFSRSPTWSSLSQQLHCDSFHFSSPRLLYPWVPSGSVPGFMHPITLFFKGCLGSLRKPNKQHFFFHLSLNKLRNKRWQMEAKIPCLLLIMNTLAWHESQINLVIGSRIRQTDPLGCGLGRMGQKSWPWRR